MNRQQILNNTPTTKSTDADWKNFHIALVETIGKKNANEMFKNYWSKLGNSSANTGNLRDYLKHEGVNLTSGNYVGDVVDFSYSVGDTLSSVMAVGKYAAIGVVVIIAVPVFIALLNIAKESGSITKEGVKGFSKMPIK